MLIEMKKSHKAMSFFAIVMIISTVLPGVIGIVRLFKLRNDSVATVGGLYVNKRDYSRALRNYQKYVHDIEDLYRRFKFKFEFDKKNPRQILLECADSVLRQDLAQKFGLAVGDKILAEKLRDFVAGGQESEQFDKQNYLYSVQAQGVTLREFEEAKRKEVSVGVLRQMLELMIIPKAMPQANAGRRGFTLWFVDTKKVADAVKKEVVTKEDLADFYAVNKAQYKTKAEVRLRYFRLAEKALRALGHADEYEISEYYRINGPSKFSNPAKYELEVLTVPTGEGHVRDERKALLEGIACGNSEGLSDKHLNVAHHGLKTIAEHKLDVVLAQAVDCLQGVNAWTPVLEVEGKFMAARVLGYLAPELKAFDEVKEEIRKIILDREAMEEGRRLVRELVQEAYDDYQGVAIVDREAERLGLNIEEGEAEDLGIGNIGGMAEGQIGCKSGSGEFLVYAISSLVAERELELSECADRVKADLLARRSSVRGEAVLTEIRDSLEKGEAPGGALVDSKKVSLCGRAEASAAFEKVGLSTVDVGRAWEMIHPQKEALRVVLQKVGQGFLVLSEIETKAKDESEEPVAMASKTKSVEEDFANGIFGSIFRGSAFKEVDSGKNQRFFQEMADF